ncbi:Tryprostatin B 6-hydroxylase [Lachnellula arida]|uniref:Tryprostatin B 6-hydroxylase n=1 Tax=Lachnellula arida TaxID=1316785 RepID=A0A8T9B6H1_9HELO|nr:Tryprostatin B 6-hydroxylase [Lachnellula arida]
MIAATFGVAIHLGYLNRGEHHLYGTLYVQIFLINFATAVLITVFVIGEEIGQAFTDITSITACYLGGLFGSLIIYRGFFHPLNKFPGPFGARISNFWFSAQLKNGDSYKKLEKLHGKYGDFLRIGSSDLSIIHPKAVHAIYGLGSKCTKAAWYDLTYPMVSLQTIRQKALHDHRRRIWSTVFSDKALRGYEDRMKTYRSQLVYQINTFGGQPVNVTKWFNLYTFDVMGDLAFGTSFDMLASKEEHWAIKLLGAGIEPLKWMFPVWFFRIMISLPKLGDDWWKFINYCSSKLDERMSAKPVVPDIMSSLLEPWKNQRPTGADLSLLQGDSQLIVVAGSDTTAATLTYIFYELLHNQSHISKLRDEVAPYVDVSGNVDHAKIANLNHLNGIIHETLRLHPPVPTALQRITPPEGIKIGDTYIPGNMTVYCPQYVLGQSENIYLNAQSFVPERWYSHPEMIKERSAFAPFSAGAYGCIGRPLALLNIRTTIIKLLTTFDISFAVGEDGSTLKEKSREHFTMGLEDFNVKFVKRVP